MLPLMLWDITWRVFDLEFQSLILSWNSGEESPPNFSIFLFPNIDKMEVVLQIRPVKYLYPLNESFASLRSIQA